jgi:tetratricopeptide (TPR) repeat protein
LDDFDQCLAKNKLNKRCLLAKAFALFQLKRYKDSYRIYTKVIGMDKDNPIALCNRGLVAGRFLCRYKEAITDLDRASAIANEEPRGN